MSYSFSIQSLPDQGLYWSTVARASTFPLDSKIMSAPLDDERLTTVGLFLETHAGLSALLRRRMAEYPELPDQSLEVLLRLVRSPRGELRMSDLAAQAGLSPSGLTRAVDRLEAAGLVARTSCPSDRRGAYAVVTDKAREVLEAVIPTHLADID